MSNLVPKLGDNENPLVSIFIHTQKYAPYLRQCLDSVYAQTYNNIEIVFFDTSATVDSWNIALEFAARYPGTMTLGRNRLDFEAEKDQKKNLNQFRCAATGTYVLDLRPDDMLSPEYVSQFVTTKKNAFRDASVPLVSIFIYNYNYGRYLKQCLESVFAQTYRNIEILFSDNDSTDDSWNIASEFAALHPGRMTIMRNRRNFGPQSNSANCYRMVQGKYFSLLCSDDVFLPEFVEKCVQAMENNKTAKFAMVHRHTIDHRGNITEEPPFYNETCIIPGAEQAAVYMLAAVNPSISQVMYNSELALGHTLTRGLIERWLSYRILDFNLCFKSDLVYIKEPLLLHRMHSSSETSAIDNSLIQVLAQYVYVHQCAEIADTNDFRKAADRLPQAVEKLGRLCLRYCVRMIGVKDEAVARKYFHLSQVLMPDIIETESYKMLEQFWQSDYQEKVKIFELLKVSAGLVSRTVSYDPPPGSVPIELKKVYHRGLP